MTIQEIIPQLEALGQEGTKKILLKHGNQEPLFGVKIEDLKKIQKKIKKDHPLSLELFNTGIYDAMYLAALIADETRMTRADLQHWVENAQSKTIRHYTIPWIAAESAYGMELALEWIESEDERIAESGWATISNVVSITADEGLDMQLLQSLLDRIERNIHNSPNCVKQNMNSCVIAIGCFVKGLTEQARQTARAMGEITVFMGGTACKTPNAIDYIQKVADKGYIGKKKKEARC